MHQNVDENIRLTWKEVRHLILHIGKKAERKGLNIQKEIDFELGRVIERQEYEKEKYPHEAYIRLEWVDDFEQIKRFIDMAYNSK